MLQINIPGGMEVRVRVVGAIIAGVWLNNLEWSEQNRKVV